MSRNTISRYLTAISEGGARYCEAESSVSAKVEEMKAILDYAVSRAPEGTEHEEKRLFLAYSRVMSGIHRDSPGLLKTHCARNNPRTSGA